MNKLNYNELKKHTGHKIKLKHFVDTCDPKADPSIITIECMKCEKILSDFHKDDANKTYVFINLGIRNGEYEYNCYHVSEVQFEKTDEKLKEYVDMHAECFYSGESHTDKDSNENVIYYFYGGEVAVTIEDYKFISKEEYEILKKYIK